MCLCTYTHTCRHSINTYNSLSHIEKKKKKPPSSQLWDQTRMRIIAIQEDTEVWSQVALAADPGWEWGGKGSLCDLC